MRTNDSSIYRSESKKEKFMAAYDNALGDWPVRRESHRVIC
ncbi:hypothetical protein [Paenibacillus beijingensis]|nr:hypothetical protein [Paenibacillus beijingensis]